MLGLRVLLIIKVIIKVEFVDTKIKLLLFLNGVCSKLIKLIQRCYTVPERKKKWSDKIFISETHGPKNDESQTGCTYETGIWSTQSAS